MLYLDRERLDTILGARGLTLNKLAENCSISRQSIYNMFSATPIFNSTFEKIRQYLNVDYRAITSDKTVAFEVLKNAPERVRIAAFKLYEFCTENEADMLLFSSNSAGRFGQKPDWNFALFFAKKEKDKEVRILRQKLQDQVAPFSINIINLNQSPIWLKLLVKAHFVRLCGYSQTELIFSSRD